MERNDWLLLAGAAGPSIALVLIVTHWIFPSIDPPQVAAFAAIVQAIGVFAAVSLSSRANGKQAARYRKQDYVELVRATNAIVHRALVTANWIRECLVNEIADPNARNPHRMMEQAHIALAAIPAHMLRDTTLIAVALLVKTDAAEILDFIGAAQPRDTQDIGPLDNLDFRTPEQMVVQRNAFIACLDRAIGDSHRFMAVVARVLNEHGVRSHP